MGCSGKRMRSPPRSGRCWSICGSWRWSGRSASSSSIGSSATGRRAAEAGRGRDAAADAAQAAAAQLPDVEARLEQLYKMGRAGYWRLLLNVDDLQALGRAYRTASALTAIDRARVQRALRDARCAGARAQDAAGAGRRDRRPAGGGRPRARRGREGRRGPDRTGRRDRCPPRPERAARRRAAGGPAEAPGLSRADGRGPGRPCAAAAAPVPGGSALAGAGARPAAVRASADQPVRHGHRQKRHGNQAEEGQPVRNVHEGTVAYADQFEGYGNLVIVDHGARAYSLYGYLGLCRRHAAASGSRPAGRVGTVGRNPSGNSALYFELRVDGSRRRSLTMAEEATLIPGSRDTDT